MMHACAQAPYNLCLKPSCNMSLCALRTQTGRCNCKSPRWTIRAMLDASASAASRAARCTKAKPLRCALAQAATYCRAKSTRFTSSKDWSASKSSVRRGDIVLVNGIEEIGIGATLCDLSNPEALPMIAIDEPTLTMNFCVNTSPLAGREGKFVTSRQLRERLMRELNHNVALRVKDTEDETVFEVSGRGELHLTILIENMRREGYELAVSRPRVVMREINGIQHEPFELLTVDIEDAQQGGVMEEIGRRKGELLDMASDVQGRIRLEYRIAARGLIGLQSVFMTLTRGTGLMSHIFDAYAPVAANSGGIGARRNGALISQDDGAAVAYALWKLQERGRMFVHPGDTLYEGMIIGIHSRENDLVVNPVREKKLTNIRAAGKDEHIDLVPPVPLSLEYAAEFVDDDELVEVTPQSIRLRKRFLKEHERRRAQRSV